MEFVFKIALGIVLAFLFLSCLPFLMGMASVMFFYAKDRIRLLFKNKEGHVFGNFIRYMICALGLGLTLSAFLVMIERHYTRNSAVSKPADLISDGMPYSFDEHAEHNDLYTREELFDAAVEANDCGSLSEYSMEMRCNDIILLKNSPYLKKHLPVQK